MTTDAPQGVLLVGAPGTGKTLLAKAVAGAALQGRAKILRVHTRQVTLARKSIWTKLPRARRPLVEAAATMYAHEKGITPWDCP